MEDPNKYFKEKINESADYFEKWLFSRESEMFVNNGEPKKQTFYCDLHDIFYEYNQTLLGRDSESSHNCIGCNFDEGARNIYHFFTYNKNVDSKIYVLTLYSLLFYLQAERLGVIYKEIGYTVGSGDKTEFNWEEFPELQRIKYWANFFKHPKSYMLLHHPQIYIEGDPNIPNFMVNGIIDDEFIHRFYSGGRYNQDLRGLLENQDNYIIIFPDILDLTTKLCHEFERIVETISSNPAHIEKLAEYTTINH